MLVDWPALMGHQIIMDTVDPSLRCIYVCGQNNDCAGKIMILTLISFSLIFSSSNVLFFSISRRMFSSDSSCKDPPTELGSNPRQISEVPLNSDMDYRIFNVRMIVLFLHNIFACVYTLWTLV